MENVNGIVKLINPPKGYIILGTAGDEITAGKDVYVPLKAVKASGITGKVKKGDEMSVAFFRQADGGLRAKHVNVVGDRQAQKRAVKVQRQREVDEVLRKIDSHNGSDIFKVTTVAGKLVGYQVDQIPSRYITLEHARTAIGKVIETKQCAGHGVKTNDPTISKAMKGPSNGQSEKKKK